MAKMNRRSMLKSIGLASAGISAPYLLSGETLHPPHSTKKTSLQTDIVIVGGGTAGVIAAIQAGRAGSRVILIENGSQLGGTITTGGVAFPGIFFAWGKQIIGGIGWELVQETVSLNDDSLPDFSVPHGRQHWKHQIKINGYLYALLAEEKCLEAGVDLRYYETPTEIRYQRNTWNITTAGKGTLTEISCRQLIDCTGNALATSMAGFDVIRDLHIQPGTLMFRLEGYEFGELDLELIQQRYQEAIRKGILNKDEFRGDIVGLLRTKGNNIQHIADADSTSSESHTSANIQGRTSLLKHLRFLRTLPGCEKTKLTSMQTETAVRESYRIDGHYKITHEDYLNARWFEDAVSYSYYPLDLHDQQGIRPVPLPTGTVPMIPLRALIPRGSRNFLVAGRCISSDRLANSALRVQASSMGMAQAAAAAAVLACKYDTTPLEVPFQELQRLIEDHGGIVPRKEI